MSLKDSYNKHRGLYLGGGAGIVLFLGYEMLKRRSGSSAAPQAVGPSQYLTPDQLATAPGGEILTLGGGQGAAGGAGGAGGFPILTGYGSAPAPGGAGASASAGGTVPTASLAAELGFSNPNTPVAVVNGQLIDTGSGRPAYYSSGGNPATPSYQTAVSTWGAGSFATGKEPYTGMTVYYKPGSYSYGDASRPPVPAA